MNDTIFGIKLLIFIQEIMNQTIRGVEKLEYGIGGCVRHWFVQCCGSIWWLSSLGIAGSRKAQNMVIDDYLGEKYICVVCFLEFTKLLLEM